MQHVVATVVVVGRKQGGNQPQRAFVIMVGGLVMVVIVRQPDIEMIAIGLDDDLVVVAVLFRNPHGCGDGGRREIDEEQQAKREPPGEPAGDSSLEWL